MVIEVITPAESRPPSLKFLLGFLEAWKKRPDLLAQFTFRWCCSILERPREPLLFPLLDTAVGMLMTHDFARVLKIGFRFIRPGYRINQIIRLDYTSHLERIFRAASVCNDEVIADALYAWMAHQDHISHCPLEILFHERKGVDRPFPPRLRRVSIRTIEDVWRKEFGVSEVLLKRIYVKLDEMEMGKDDWGELILKAVRSSPGVSLPLHYWRLLGDLAHSTGLPRKFEDLCSVKMMKLLEVNREWERLEVWMGIIWQFKERPVVILVEDVERVTLKLLLRQPSALPKFEELGPRLKGSHAYLDRKLLELICTLAQVKPTPSATGFLPWVNSVMLCNCLP